MSTHPHWQESSPEKHVLTVRDLRFERSKKRERGADPVASAWFAALSCSFPRGEAMFIEAVRTHRDDVPPELAGQIRDFIRQEVNHSREHIAFNRAIEDVGYEISNINSRVNALVDMTLSKPPIVQLAITCALEHFTAMFAHQFLKDPGALATAGMGDPALWMWHAVEEIEHKAVAYDTWIHATRSWSAFKRWRVRSLVMVLVTTRFLRNRATDAAELLAQDGITGWRGRLALARYLFGKPGILRKIFPAWLGYFRPGFHPWDHDDRHLIAQWELQQQENDTAAEADKVAPATA